MNDPSQYQYTYISFYYQGWRSGRFLQLVAFFIEKPSITVIKASRGGILTVEVKGVYKGSQQGGIEELWGNQDFLHSFSPWCIYKLAM